MEFHDTLLRNAERLGAVDAKANASHNRIDRLEIEIASDLTDIKKELHSISAWVNQSKGWAAAAFFLWGSIGALFGGLLAKILK
jgi:hypothetical protein